MDGDRPLLGDAGTDAVGSLPGFRPAAAEPYPPVAVLGGSGFVPPIIYGHAVRVAEQHDIAGTADNAIAPIQLGLNRPFHRFDRLAGLPQLSRGQDVRCDHARGIDVMIGAAVPGCCDLVESAVSPPSAVNHQIRDDGSGTARAARRFSVLTAILLNRVGFNRSPPSLPPSPQPIKLQISLNCPKVNPASPLHAPTWVSASANLMRCGEAAE